MVALSTRNQAYIGSALALLMMTTRSHHFASLHHFPDASWAVFFLAGVYLRARWVFVALCVGAVVADYIAITLGGVSDFCVTGAYVMLAPAYGALWLGGRWYAAHHTDRPETMFAFGGALFVATVAAELISSGSFYYLSGRITDPNIAEFSAAFVQYFPRNLANLALYATLAACLHAGVVIAGIGNRPAR